MRNCVSIFARFSATIVFSIITILTLGCGSGSVATSSPGQPTPSDPSPTLVAIAVTPASVTLGAGATQQLAATATYSDGSTGNVTSTATWTSSASGVTRVNASGVAAAIANGSATVTAASGGVSGTASITVAASAPAVTGITITPAAASVTAGATQQFTATATYSDGSSGNVTSAVTWSASSSALATINTAGLATAVSTGNATVTATLSGVRATASLTVAAAAAPAPTLVSITVLPPTANLAVGASQSFTATGNYSDGSTQNIAASVTWTSSSTAVATISSAGVATAVGAGTATMTATEGGLTGTAGLTVMAAAAPTLMSVLVTPATASISAGSTQQFTATGTYSDGSTANVTSQASWKSAASSVATVNGSGLATAVGAGSSAISASVNGISGSATLSVTAAVPASISITPASPSFSAGSTQQFTATATYANGTTANVTSQVNWASSNAAVVTVNATGLATGVSSGSASITAAEDGVTGTTVLTVTAKVPSSIAVTPNPASFSVGATQQFTATASYSDGSTANVTSSVTWITANTSVATINSSGLATGVAAGTSTASATLGSVSGQAAVSVTTAAPASTVSITTYHGDTSRSGLNDKETTLTPANVNPSSFGKLFSYLVDGYVYGSPLILSNVTVNGATHNVVYVATENDSVYAFDADSYGTGAPLWKVSLLQSGETALTNATILPVQGVTSTPVIDPLTGTLYVVSTQRSSSSGGTFRLHALDVTTGAEKFGGPVTISASVPGTGEGGSTETLTTSCVQRAALLLANGNVYIGFGGCHSGWLLAYNASTLQQVGAFNSSPILDGEGTYASAGGVWMGGAGPVADSAGNVYITTGNGPWNGTNALADSVLKFGPTPVSGANGTMQPIDYFTPSIYQYMDCADADLAAGGLLLVPGSNQLIAGGKTGTMYVINSQNMGHESATDAGVTQEQVWGQGITDGGTYADSCTDSAGTHTAQITSYEIFGSAAFFNNSVFLGVTPTSATSPSGVRQFAWNGGAAQPLSAVNSPQSAPGQYQGTRGTSPFISANGTSEGIVWVIDQGNPLQGTYSATPTAATLYAYSADQYPTELYDSTQNPGDAPGYGIKFSSPVVANGKVYLSSGHDVTTANSPQGEIDVYGLRPNPNK